MGFYDCRCAITGVSLKGADATAVLLQRVGRAFRPIALPIKGNYNRLGSIDGVTPDANTRLVLKFFLDALENPESQEFVIDEPYYSEPLDNIEGLLWGFERNTNDNGKTAVLNGQPVVVALVCRAVWDAVARATKPRGPDAARFAALFRGVPAAERIYAGKLASVSRLLRELDAVNAFMARRGIRWAPTKAGGQDFAPEMRRYLAAAQKKFRRSAAVSVGLRAYEREVADLLRDEDD